MGRVGEALLLLGVICLAATAVTLRFNYAVRKRRIANAPWELAEHTSDDGDYMVVSAERPGEDRIMIASIATGDPEFEYKIEEIRAVGKAKLAALNSGRKR